MYARYRRRSDKSLKKMLQLGLASASRFALFSPMRNCCIASSNMQLRDCAKRNDFSKAVSNNPIDCRRPHKRSNVCFVCIMTIRTSERLASPCMEAKPSTNSCMSTWPSPFTSKTSTIVSMSSTRMSKASSSSLTVCTQFATSSLVMTPSLFSSNSSRTSRRLLINAWRFRMFFSLRTSRSRWAIWIELSTKTPVTMLSTEKSMQKI
mmetsp:Transcript_81879/g.236702  ORF Transcript_81879/g.236702 Transcript_81879/m.236702 type:complete len:207 (-) Transcript_81879:388-1008(-)